MSRVGAGKLNGDDKPKREPAAILRSAPVQISEDGVFGRDNAGRVEHGAVGAEMYPGHKTSKRVQTREHAFDVTSLTAQQLADVQAGQLSCNASLPPAEQWPQSGSLFDDEMGVFALPRSSARAAVCFVRKPQTVLCAHQRERERFQPSAPYHIREREQERATPTSRVERSHMYQQRRRKSHIQSGSEEVTYTRAEPEEVTYTRAELEEATYTSSAGRSHIHEQSWKKSHTRAELEEVTHTSRVERSHTHEQRRKKSYTRAEWKGVTYTSRVEEVIYTRRAGKNRHTQAELEEVIYTRAEWKGVTYTSNIRTNMASSQPKKTKIIWSEDSEEEPMTIEISSETKSSSTSRPPIAQPSRNHPPGPAARASTIQQQHQGRPPTTTASAVQPQTQDHPITTTASTVQQQRQGRPPTTTASASQPQTQDRPLPRPASAVQPQTQDHPLTRPAPTVQPQSQDRPLPRPAPVVQPQRQNRPLLTTAPTVQPQSQDRPLPRPAPAVQPPPNPTTSPHPTPNSDSQGQREHTPRERRRRRQGTPEPPTHRFRTWLVRVLVALFAIGLAASARRREEEQEPAIHMPALFQTFHISAAAAECGATLDVLHPSFDSVLNGSLSAHWAGVCSMTRAMSDHATSLHALAVTQLPTSIHKSALRSGKLTSVLKALHSSTDTFTGDHSQLLGNYSAVIREAQDTQQRLKEDMEWYKVQAKRGEYVPDYMAASRLQQKRIEAQGLLPAAVERLGQIVRLVEKWGDNAASLRRELERLLAFVGLHAIDVEMVQSRLVVFLNGLRGGGEGGLVFVMDMLDALFGAEWTWEAAWQRLVGAAHAVGRRWLERRRE